MTTLGDGSNGGGSNGGNSGGTGNGGGTGGSSGSTGGSAGAGSTSGGGQTSWRDSLPADIKDNESLKQFTNVENLAKSYLHANSLVGKKGIVPPGEKASDEEWERFYTDLGRPALDKFDIKTPEGKQVNAEVIAKFKEQAFKAGMLPKQAQKLVEWFVGHEESVMAARSVAKTKEQDTALAGLRKEWGDGYDRQISLGELAIEKVGGQGFAEYLTKSGLNKDVTIIKFLNSVGKLLGEDRVRGEGGGKFGQTPGEIETSINAIMGNMQHPYHDPSHPGHKNAVDEMSALFQKRAS